MSAPSTWATGFVYREITGKTDVQDLIDLAVDAILGTLPSGDNLAAEDCWTDLGGGEYQTPAQDPTGANRFMRVLLSRVSATRLQFHAKDKSGATINDGRSDFATSYTGRVWAGPYHLVMEMEYGASVYEVSIAAMADPTPLTLGSTGSVYAFARSHRNSAGTAHASNLCDMGFCNDAVVATNTARLSGYYNFSSAVNPLGYTEAGSIVALPVELCTNVTGSVWKNVGKLYQFVVLPHDLSAGTEVDLALDSGLIGTFKIHGIPGEGTSVHGRQGVRIA